MTSTTRLVLAASFTLVASVALTVVATIPYAGAQQLETGAISVVDPGGDPIRGGDASTLFTFELPASEAWCPGDSANDGYRVNSFIVPAEVAATDIVFDGLGPTPIDRDEYATFRAPLNDQFGSDFASAQTAEQAEPGGPGAIINLPLLWFGVYTEGFNLPAGDYRIGLACTVRNEIERVWDAEIAVVVDDADPLGQIAWTVTDQLPTEPNGSNVPLQAAAAAAGVLVVFGFLRSRSRAGSPTRPNLEIR